MKRLTIPSQSVSQVSTPVRLAFAAWGGPCGQMALISTGTSGRVFVHMEGLSMMDIDTGKRRDVHPGDGTTFSVISFGMCRSQVMPGLGATFGM